MWTPTLCLVDTYFRLDITCCLVFYCRVGLLTIDVWFIMKMCPSSELAIDPRDKRELLHFAHIFHSCFLQSWVAFDPSKGFFGQSVDFLPVSNMSEIEEGLRCKVNIMTFLWWLFLYHFIKFVLCLKYTTVKPET